VEERSASPDVKRPLGFLSRARVDVPLPRPFPRSPAPVFHPKVEIPAP